MKPLLPALLALGLGLPAHADSDRDMNTIRSLAAANGLESTLDSVLLRRVTAARLADRGRFPIVIADYIKVRDAAFQAERGAQIALLDLDSDGTITAAEYAMVGQYGSANRDLRIERWDANHDGSLDPSEIAAYRGSPPRREDKLEMRIIDLDQDGTVTEAEARRFDAAIILNAAAPPSHQPRPADQPCELPPPSAGARIVVLSTSDGEALSTATIVGQDEVTTLGHVVIEPGDEPIYVLAGSLGQMIWKVEGATSRIERFVVQPGTSRQERGATGVAGLPPGKVTFSASRACFTPFFEAPGGQASLEQAVLASRLGRAPDRMLAAQRLGEARLPSGPVATRRKLSGLTPAEMDVVRQFPAGIVRLDPQEVVGSVPVESYQVLPGMAGIGEYIRAGLIRQTDDGFYVIQKPIPRFPPASDGLSLRYILGKGVPLPDGNPRNSRVYSEETGACLTCR